MTRVRIERIVSPVQGADSWVELTRPKVKTIRQILEKYGELGGDDVLKNMDAARDMCVACIHKWNWVDDDDQPLPQIKDNPDVFDELTTAEVSWLSAQLVGRETQEDERKKK